MSFTIEWLEQGVHIHFRGTVRDQDILDVYHTINGDPRFDALRFQIMNYQQVAKIAYGVEDIFKYAHLTKASSLSNQQMKIAQVGGPDDALALANLYQCETDDTPWQFEVFVDETAALHWAAAS
jgi:hypothetical protein